MMGILSAWGMLIRAAWIDWRTMLLPDVYTLGGAALVMVVQVARGNAEQALLGAGVGFVLLKGTQLLYRHLRHCEGLGSGDPKLMLALGALLGYPGVVYAVGGASLLALFCNVHQLRKDVQLPVPFGPYLVAVGLVLDLWP